MSLLEFEKKKRNKAVTVRMSEESAKKLKKIAAVHNVSQADVIERLIDRGFKELVNTKKDKY